MDLQAKIRWIEATLEQQAMVLNRLRKEIEKMEQEQKYIEGLLAETKRQK